MLTIEEIKAEKKFGDMVKVATALRTTPDVVRMSLNRPKCIRHTAVKAVFTQLINERKTLNSKK